MQAIKAIYDGANFMPQQPIPVKGKYEVVITFIEPINEESTDINKTDKLPRSTAKGFLKGKVYMANDFNEPLDRLIIASALAEDLTIITADENIQKYDVEWVW